jgi:hypothetical protein
MFTRHRLGLTNRLDCPDAMGTDAFPPQRAKSFHHVLLLPSPSVVYHGRNPTTLRVSLGAGAAEFQASGLRQGVSRRLIGDADHFWQKRYYDFNIRNYPQFVEKLRYIHRNPVKAGLCERPEDWEWSSFRHYATGSEGRVEIESEWTARKREPAAGRVCSAVELPHSSQNRA